MDNSSPRHRRALAGGQASVQRSKFGTRNPASREVASGSGRSGYTRTPSRATTGLNSNRGPAVVHDTTTGFKAPFSEGLARLVAEAVNYDPYTSKLRAPESSGHKCDLSTDTSTRNANASGYESGESSSESDWTPFFKPPKPHDAHHPASQSLARAGVFNPNRSSTFPGTPSRIPQPASYHPYNSPTSSALTSVHASRPACFPESQRQSPAAYSITTPTALQTGGVGSDLMAGLAATRRQSERWQSGRGEVDRGFEDEDSEVKHQERKTCLLVDELDSVVGIATRAECRELARQGGGLHRTVAVAIVDSTGSILCSLRSTRESVVRCGFASSSDQMTSLGAVANDCFSGAVFVARKLIVEELKLASKTLPPSLCSHWGRFLFKTSPSENPPDHQLVHVVLVELEKDAVFNKPNDPNLKLCWLSEKELDSRYGSKQDLLTPFFRTLYTGGYLSPLLKKDFRNKPNSYSITNLTSKSLT